MFIRTFGTILFVAGVLVLLAGEGVAIGGQPIGMPYMHPAFLALVGLIGIMPKVAEYRLRRTLGPCDRTR